MWMVFIMSGPTAEDDLANQLASYVSTGVKGGVPVKGS